MTSDYTIMWKVNSSEYLLDTNITWCLIVEKIDLMNLIISWHAQKRESRVGRSSLLIHSYIRFIHRKTVLCIPLHDGALHAVQWVTIHLFFGLSRPHCPASLISLVTLKECLVGFSNAQSDNKKWCKAPLIFKTMDGLVPGHKWPKT